MRAVEWWWDVWVHNMHLPNLDACLDRGGRDKTVTTELLSVLAAAHAIRTRFCLDTDRTALHHTDL